MDTPTDVGVECESCTLMAEQFHYLVDTVLRGLSTLAPPGHHHRTAALNLVLDTLAELGVEWAVNEDADAA